MYQNTRKQLLAETLAQDLRAKRLVYLYERTKKTRSQMAKIFGDCLQSHCEKNIKTEMRK